MTSNLEKITEKFSRELEEVDNIIQEHTRSSRPLMNEAVENLLQAGGKRVRPLLLMMCASESGGSADSERVLGLAAAIEILHMATLIHDDIVDESEMRRGITTAAQEYGQKKALFIGDYLLSSAYGLFHAYLEGEDLNRLDDLLQAVCEGEMREFAYRYNMEIDFRDYLRQIRRKTALFFGFAAYLGGRAAGAEGMKLKLLRRFGIKLGIAFQIQDDLLDFTGNPDRMGKPVGKDLENGVYSLPVICLINDEERAAETRRILERRPLQREELDKLRRLMKESGALEKLKTLERRYLHKAERAISVFDSSRQTRGAEIFLKLLEDRRE